MMRAPWAAVAALAILAPLGAAATLAYGAATPGTGPGGDLGGAVAEAGGLLPPSVPAAANGRASITIQQGGDVTPGQPHALNVTVTHCPAAAGRHALTLEAHDAPAWLNVTFRPETYRFQSALPEECESATGAIRLLAGPGAPGFTLASFKVRAVDAAGATVARTDYAFRVGHYSNLTVSPPWGPVRLPDGGHATVKLTVENHGNADALVRVDAAGLPDGVRALLPPDAVVSAPSDDGEPGRRTLDLALVAADEAPGAFDLHLVVTSHFPMDPGETGDGGVVSIHVEPASGGLPPILPAAGLGALGIAAVFMARRYLAGLGGGKPPTPA